nr:lipase 3 [Quercus suber]
MLVMIMSRSIHGDGRHVHKLEDRRLPCLLPSARHAFAVGFMALFLATTLFAALVLAGSRNHPGLGSPSNHHGAPTVNIRNGSITGVHSTTYNQDLFLGVPYAKPPVADLRFRNPQSIDAKFNGTLKATEYAPECVGYGGDQIGYPVSEDCLYFNVIRPSGYEHQHLPVGIWIHGGGLTEGGTRDERYNLSFTVQNSVDIGKPIIAVSIAYRLREHRIVWWRPEESDDLGELDADLSASGFPLDVKKVTNFTQGESAGAASVGWHLTAYNGRDDGLFRAGIMESGNPVNYNSYRDPSVFQPGYDALVQAVGCDQAIDGLGCLRTARFEQLNDFLNSSDSTAWAPIVDGDFIARYASIQLAEGAFVHVPVIDGANSEEGTAFGPKDINTDEEFLSYVSANTTATTVLPRFASGALAAYPNTCSYFVPSSDEVPCNVTWPAGYGAEYRRTAAYAGDAKMVANRRGTCETWAKHGLAAYCYRFNTIPAGLPWYVGVTHFQEVAFVFDNTAGLGYNAAHGTINPFTDKPQSYYDLAELMSKSWASFIYDLDPNGYRGRPSATPAWPVYDLAAPQDFVWDTNSSTLAYPEPDTFRAEGIRWILDHALAYRR